MTVKRLKLEELKIGMYVSVAELNGIIGIPIILRESSIDYSEPYPKGEIVSIGEQGVENIDSNDSLYIYHAAPLDEFEGAMGD